MEDPHFRERGFWVDVDHPVMGRFKATGPQFRMENGWRQRLAPPLLGQHQQEIQADLAAERPRSNSQRKDTRTLPLANIRVLDLTVVWAGPLCTTLLSDLGAEVIRLDNPNLFPTATRGAVMRPAEGREAELGQLWSAYPGGRAGKRPWNQPGPFVCHARNKLGATLDLRTELGRETFLSLVEQSDILVENNSVKVLDQLGIGWPVLHERNPRLIALRLPSLGLSGPYRDFIGFGAHMEALCGLSSLRGYEDLSPTDLDPTYFMDPASGVTAAFAALCALRRRETTGLGELVEVAQAENLLNYIGEYVIDVGFEGDAHPYHANRHPQRAPQGVYPCDGVEQWIAISIADDEAWLRFVELLGTPAEAVGFEDEYGRHAAHLYLDELMADWTGDWERDELVDACRRVGITAGPVLNEPELLADPHLAARGFFRTNASEDVPETTFAGHLWTWDGPDLVWNSLNRMGADNEYVYREILGLDDEAMDRLAAERHLSLDYLDTEGRPL
jgi:crotonobetainyl-CoA:carnitine CoA-transferase CaiB-like acyl-CoA transferase